MIEIYKDLIGYGNKYEVSNLGNVRLKENKKILKQYKCRGYMYVGLYYEGKTRNKRVHRLVAKTFLDNYTDKCVVMHLDNNPSNNNVNNLKCGTQKENIQQCLREGRLYVKAKKIKQYDRNMNFIKEWETQQDIKKELGYKVNFISMCCHNVKKTAYGYIWRLSENE